MASDETTTYNVNITEDAYRTVSEWCGKNKAPEGTSMIKYYIWFHIFESQEIPFDVFEYIVMHISGNVKNQSDGTCIYVDGLTGKMM